MAGLISTFLITLVFALFLTLASVLAIKSGISSVLEKKQAPDAGGETQKPTEEAIMGAQTVKNKLDPLRPLAILAAQIFFTVAMWFICIDTAREIWTIFKAGK